MGNPYRVCLNVLNTTLSILTTMDADRDTKNYLNNLKNQNVTEIGTPADRADHGGSRGAQAPQGSVTVAGVMTRSRSRAQAAQPLPKETPERGRSEAATTCSSTKSSPAAAAISRSNSRSSGGRDSNPARDSNNNPVRAVKEVAAVKSGTGHSPGMATRPSTSGTAHSTATVHSRSSSQSRPADSGDNSGPGRLSTQASSTKPSQPSKP